VTAKENYAEGSVEICPECRVGRLYESMVSGKRRCSNANCAGSLGFPRPLRGRGWNKARPGKTA